MKLTMTLHFAFLTVAYASFEEKIKLTEVKIQRFKNTDPNSKKILRWMH